MLQTHTHTYVWWQSNWFSMNRKWCVLCCCQNVWDAMQSTTKSICVAKKRFQSCSNLNHVQRDKRAAVLVQKLLMGVADECEEREMRGKLDFHGTTFFIIHRLVWHKYEQQQNAQHWSKHTTQLAENAISQFGIMASEGPGDTKKNIPLASKGMREAECACVVFARCIPRRSTLHPICQLTFTKI